MGDHNLSVTREEDFVNQNRSGAAIPNLAKTGQKAFI